VKTANLPLKVALAGLLSGLSLLPAPAQQQPDLRGTSPTSRRVFDRILTDDKTTNQTKPDQTRSGKNQPNATRPEHLIEISLRLAPTIALNTASGQSQYAGFQPNGFGIRYSVGPTIDYFFFRNSYAFSSGLWFSVRRSGYQMPGTFGQTKFTPGLPDQQSVYNLQYLQVPVSLKLFANNIAPGWRLYLQTGGLLDIKLAENAQDETRNGLYKFAESSGTYQRQYTPVDLELLLGAGLQYQLGASSALNLGLSYQRGLLSVARANDLDARLRTISVDLGFKF
jgi:hypothetical protein